MTTPAAPDRTAQRDQLVAAYGAAFDGLLSATEGLDGAGWSAPTGCPGWSVHDQLAHCIGLERRLLGDPDLDPDVQVPDLPHLTDDVGRWIERDVHARRRTPDAELRAEAVDTFERRRAQLAELTPEQLEQQVEWMLGRTRTTSMLRTRTFDLVSHERDVRAAVERLAGFAGPAVDLAVEHSLRAWARAVPARVDDGRTIAFVVGDHGTVTLDLASGELHRDDVAAATAAATVHLDAATVLALAGGRSDAPSDDELTVTGDADLVRRFLAVAAVTF